MKNYKDILLSPESTIRDALKIIDSGAIKIGVVVDKNEKLVGTVTDGDIRRGILNSLSLDDAIDSVVCKTPTKYFQNIVNSTKNLYEKDGASK